MFGYKLKLIRPEHAHVDAPVSSAFVNPASPPSHNHNAQANAAAQSLHSTNSKEAIDDSGEDIPHSRPRPWWHRRICHIPAWALLLLSVLVIIGIILGAVLGIREARRHKDDMSEIRSDYWYTISESDDVVPKGYLCDQYLHDRRNPLSYPGTYRQSNDTRELTGTHWQFLRANRTERFDTGLSTMCQTALEEGSGEGRGVVYWLLNRAQGPGMRLGYDNSKWYGREWDEPSADDEDEIRVKMAVSGSPEHLWYVKRRKGEDRYILVNCDAFLIEPRRLGRTWDGRPIGEGPAGAVLTKNNGTESDNPTLWTVSSDIGGQRMKIEEKVDVEVKVVEEDSGWNVFE